MPPSIRRRFMHKSKTEILLPQTIKDTETRPRLATIPKHKRLFGIPRRVLSWLYSTSLGLFLLLFIGFNTVLPIDAIVQSKRNLALNTLVVLICCVIFIVVCLILYSIRVFMLRLSLQDIPKLYIPDHFNDLPLSCYNYIQQNISRCQEIVEQGKPIQEIQHPGLYHAHDQDSTEVDSLPNYLVYEDVLIALGETSRYRGFLLKSNILKTARNANYAELLTIFKEKQLAYMNPKYLNDYITTYERLRFSGNPITHEDFLMLMELFVRLMDFVDPSGMKKLGNNFSVTNFKQHLTGSQSMQQLTKSKPSGLTLLNRMNSNDSVLIWNQTRSFSIVSKSTIPTNGNTPDAVDYDFNEYFGDINELMDTARTHSRAASAVDEVAGNHHHHHHHHPHLNHPHLIKRNSSSTLHHVNSKDNRPMFEIPQSTHTRQESTDGSFTSSISSQPFYRSATADNDDFYAGLHVRRYRSNGSILLRVVTNASDITVNTTRHNRTPSA